ncbi:MAG: hypothetical protein U9Q29_02890 [Campylobacterota bacterium]|nr:hypothetical protein [Campylobacterota bacterium]
MNRFDFFINKLKEDGFSKEELEFLAITENNITHQELAEYMKFETEYDELVEKLIQFLNEYHSSCAMY